MLLDSASLYFRSFFGVPDTLTAPDGTPVNAVRGFLDTIAYLLTTRRPQRLVACWDDDWRPAFRVAALPSYKAHRVEYPTPGPAPDVEVTPAALDVQVPIIVEVLEALGIARIGSPGYEADDVIGALATHARPGWDVEVVTGDRDLFQLVDDARPDGGSVRVLYVGRGVRNLDVIDQARLQAKYGVATGPAYADLAILRGDPSDGLPGISGIGEKTAAALLARHGDLAGLRRAVEDPAAALAVGTRTKLGQASDYLTAAEVVVRVATDSIDVTTARALDDAVPVTPRDPDALLVLAQRWNLDSSLARVVTAFTELAGT
jgi:5'-3' exonuclease